MAHRQHDSMQGDSDLPAMTEDDSFLASTPSKGTASNVFSDASHVDERAMRRHLHDIESSFLPDLSPLSSAKQTRELNLRSSSFNARMSTHPVEVQHAAARRSSPRQLESAFNAPTSRPPPQPFRDDEDQVDYDDSSFTTQPTQDQDQDLSLSSPIADATKRSQFRSNASTSQRFLSDPNNHPQITEGKLDDNVHSHDLGSTRNGSRTASQGRAPDATRSITPTQIGTSAKNGSVSQKSHSADPIQGASIQSTNSTDTQSGWLKAQQTTHRFSQESGSSFNTNGIDYALGSGGATPATLRASRELSRIPSLGSVASSIGTTDSIARRQKAQAQAAQALTGETPLDSLGEEKESPVTPRAARGLNADPTNTVLNQHVRDIEVPDTVARNYRTAFEKGNRPSTATAAATPFFGRGKSDLTLKEQNSRIDKLSKENFDLKLKIHYLYQALQDRSDEGVKDLVSKNAQLQADLLKSRKENQSLKKRVRDLDRQSSSRQGTRMDESEDELSSKDFRQGQLEEEILWLRERMQYLERENDKLNQEGVSREFEKRRLADQLKSLGSGNASRSEEVWKDMLDAESARRQQAELQTRSLQQEIARLRSNRSPVTRGLRRQASQNDLTSVRSRSDTANGLDELGSLTGTTAVEQLRLENADLRRDLGAQTSMLTSRNRERERLQEEIESLKLMHRRGEGPKSTAGDSILDRSVSRQHLRPSSRGGASQHSGMSDSEREQYETAEAALRDENMILRMRVQDMQRDLDFVMEGAEHIDTLRAERDEAIRSGDEDRDWAATTIDEMEVAIEGKTALIARLQEELESKAEESDALQQEIKSISDSLNRVADDCEASQSTIQDLQQSLANATGEIESLEQGIKEAIEAKERLEVQAESSQGEISFLREEQETDKIRISDLDAALRTVKSSAKNEQERMREVAALEADLATTREDARRLRKELTNKHDEYTASKESIDSFERRLREALGNFDGNRASLLANLLRLQQDLERADESNKEHSRIHQEHEKQLQTHSQEARRLADLLEREKQSRQEDARTLAKAQRALRNAGESGVGGGSQVSQQTLQQLSERNELLLVAWQRLATLCGSGWAERHNIRPPTREAVANSIMAIDQPLDLAIQAIEKTLSSFRTRVRNTERDIHRDFSALEAALNSRARRLDALEKSMARNGPVGSTISTAEFQRLKDENRSMAKEIRLLRQQQNFALPGLSLGMATLPSTFDAERAVSPHTTDMSASAAAAAAAADAATAAAQTAIARDYERTSSFSSAQTGPGNPTRRRSQINSPLPTSPDAQRRSISALIPHGQHQRQASTSTESHSQGNNASTTTTATTTQNAEGRMAGGRELEPADQRWLLRLQEMDARIQKEREGRALDRKGARDRLEERAQENETLRRENQRLRAAAARLGDAAQGHGQGQAQAQAQGQGQG